MDSERFVYPEIDLAKGEQITISFYAVESGKLSISFDTIKSRTVESGLGFVVFRK